MLTAIIVDDEKIARETLSGYLSKYCPNVNIVAVCEGVASAHEAILTFSPELVFLDVEMPFGNAFDLLEKFEKVSFETIFITAFSNYALKALNQSAAYYILKPVEIDELIKAVHKIELQKEEKQAFRHTQLLIDNLKTPHTAKQKIALPLMEGYEFVKVEDIVRCQANDNFTYFYLKDGRKLMICRTLKFYEEALAGDEFVRIHKSHLINMQFAERYLKGKGGQVQMLDKTVLDVSPQKKGELLGYFKD